MSRKIYINGKLVPQEDAKVSVYDHGLLYGDGVFEGLRAYGGRVFRLEQHVAFDAVERARADRDERPRERREERERTDERGDAKEDPREPRHGSFIAAAARPVKASLHRFCGIVART